MKSRNLSCCNALPHFTLRRTTLALRNLRGPYCGHDATAPVQSTQHRTHTCVYFFIASAIARSAKGAITRYPASFGCTPSAEYSARIPRRASASGVQ